MKKLIFMILVVSSFFVFIGCQNPVNEIEENEVTNNNGNNQSEDPVEDVYYNLTVNFYDYNEKVFDSYSERVIENTTRVIKHADLDTITSNGHKYEFVNWALNGRQVDLKSGYEIKVISNIILNFHTNYNDTVIGSGEDNPGNGEEGGNETPSEFTVTFKFVTNYGSEIYTKEVTSTENITGISYTVPTVMNIRDKNNYYSNYIYTDNMTRTRDYYTNVKIIRNFISWQCSGAASNTGTTTSIDLSDNTFNGTCEVIITVNYSNETEVHNSTSITENLVKTSTTYHKASAEGTTKNYTTTISEGSNYRYPTKEEFANNELKKSERTAFTDYILYCVRFKEGLYKFAISYDNQGMRSRYEEGPEKISSGTVELQPYWEDTYEWVVEN